MNAEEIKVLYQKHFDLLFPHIVFDNDGTVFKEVASESQTYLRSGIAGMQELLKHDPEHWAALWMIGQAHQTLGENALAYKYFLTSHNAHIKREHTIHADVVRELACACLQTKRFSDALYYCKVATEFDLDDFTLWTNLAVAYLFNKDLIEAEKWANKAINKNFEDQAAQNVLICIKEIKEGKRDFPDDFNILVEEFS